MLTGLQFAFVSEAKAFEFPAQGLLNLIKPSADQNSANADKNQNENKSASSDSQNDSDDKQKLSDLIANSQNSRVPDSITDPKQLEDAAEFASQTTGVNKDFLMGMLVVESNLGQNPGQCTYREVEDGANQAYQSGRLSGSSWQLFQSRRDTMKDIASGLGYDYEQLKVSCNPGYVGTGGAMGIAQFMPDIWMAYKDKIGAIVGKDNPDPWNVKDGVVAMALLVADTPGVTDHNVWAERNAAKMYLSGSTSSKYDWYANQIFYWAQNYQKLIG